MYIISNGVNKNNKYKCINSIIIIIIIIIIINK